MTTSASEPATLDQTGAALRAMVMVAVSFCALSALSYAVPGLERVRPWVTGEGFVVLRMFAERAELPGFAEAGLIGGQPDDARHVAESLGAAVAANLGSATPGGLSRPPPTDAAAGPALRISPSEYEGITQYIENPEALRNFYAQLANTAAKKPGAITRVAHYGDSSVAADAITKTARRRLQQRFGDSGHGFILMAKGNMFYGHKDIKHRPSKGWEVHSIVRRALRDGWYGYGGVQARGRAGQYTLFETVKGSVVGGKVSSFEIFFQRYPQGGTLRLKVDGKTHSSLSTRGETREDAWLVVRVPDGPHSFSVRTMGGGRNRLYGVALERDVPGVVYDSLGLVGARAQRLLNGDAEHWRRQISHRSPHLLVLGFGGNEAGNDWLDMDRYETELVSVVKMMRRGKRDMACLLFGPLDQGRRDARGKVRTIPKLPLVVQVQRKVAKAQDCAFFDVYQAMGGKGSIGRWNKSRPPLATSDFRHATPRGYEVIGNMYYKALLKGFAEYLASH